MLIEHLFRLQVEDFRENFLTNCIRILEVFEALQSLVSVVNCEIKAGLVLGLWLVGLAFFLGPRQN